MQFKRGYNVWRWWTCMVVLDAVFTFFVWLKPLVWYQFHCWLWFNVTFSNISATVDGLIFVGYQFLCFRGGSDSNSSIHEIAIFCKTYEGKHYGHEISTPWMCDFCSIHKNWYPQIVAGQLSSLMSYSYIRLLTHPILIWYQILQWVTSLHNMLCAQQVWRTGFLLLSEYEPKEPFSRRKCYKVFYKGDLEIYWVHEWSYTKLGFPCQYNFIHWLNAFLYHPGKILNTLLLSARVCQLWERDYYKQYSLIS